MIHDVSIHVTVIIYSESSCRRMLKTWEIWLADKTRNLCCWLLSVLSLTRMPSFFHARYVTATYLLLSVIHVFPFWITTAYITWLRQGCLSPRRQVQCTTNFDLQIGFILQVTVLPYKKDYSVYDFGSSNRFHTTSNRITVGKGLHRMLYLVLSKCFCCPFLELCTQHSCYKCCYHHHHHHHHHHLVCFVLNAPVKHSLYCNVPNGALFIFVVE
jgi:hypothetical protein